MKFKTFYTFSLFFAISMCAQNSLAHPTGNMILVNDRVYWSYIYPVEDVQHRACVMTWSVGEKPEIVLQSQYSASDFILYTDETNIYLIERRYLQTEDAFESRVLKMKIGEKPVVIWDWFRDLWRVGEGGFFMLSDNQMVFAGYPEIYILEKGKQPLLNFEFRYPVKKLRAVENNQILLLGDQTCYLVKQDGTIINEWNNLIDESVNNSPLNRNQVFDADYKDGRLLIAYWGKKSFELFYKSGKCETLVQQEEPLTPHWVAFRGHEKLLFSSRFFFNGETPKPCLIRLKANGNISSIWEYLE